MDKTTAAKKIYGLGLTATKDINKQVYVWSQRTTLTGLGDKRSSQTL